MIDWSGTDTVLLDMDGTLLDLAFDNYFWLEYVPIRYAEHHDISLEEARDLVMSRSETLYGSLEWYCLDHWSEHLALDVSALKHEIRERIALRPNSRDFLAWLKAREKKTVLVTNAHPEALALKLEVSGLHRHVDAMICSHDLAMAKEHAGFWHTLGRCRGIDLERSLVIDDNPGVLRRARAEGVGRQLQILQPDSGHPPVPPTEFHGIIHFTEIMNGKTDGRR